MPGVVTTPLADDLRLNVDPANVTKGAATLFQTGPRAQQKDTISSYSLPSLEEPKAPLKMIPTLPLPEKIEARQGKKRPQKEVEDEQDQNSVFKPFGHFGMPFKTDAGSEVGMTPHPQLLMARTVEDCAHTMAVGRELTTKTILDGDHPQLEKIGETSNEKLRESIEKAKEQKGLSYVQDTLTCMTIIAGIVGGVILTGSGGGVSGLAMIAGGSLELGSYCLDYLGYGDSNWKTLATYGGAALTLLGGYSGKDLLLKKSSMMELVSLYGSASTSFVEGYTAYKKAQMDADLSLFAGDLVTLDKERQLLSESMTKHYGALNIKDFSRLFKAATEFVNQSNQAVKSVIQGTLKG